MEDFAVTCPLVPSVPHLISGSCSSPRAFGLGFLQTPPRDDALALLLAFGSAKTWHEDFHLVSSVPCRAHTLSSAARTTPPVSLLQAPPNASGVVWVRWSDWLGDRISRFSQDDDDSTYFLGIPIILLGGIRALSKTMQQIEGTGIPGIPSLCGSLSSARLPLASVRVHVSRNLPALLLTIHRDSPVYNVFQQRCGCHYPFVRARTMRLFSYP